MLHLLSYPFCVWFSGFRKNFWLWHVRFLLELKPFVLSARDAMDALERVPNLLIGCDPNSRACPGCPPTRKARDLSHWLREGRRAAERSPANIRRSPLKTQNRRQGVEIPLRCGNPFKDG